jgi:hypothetical protein
MDTAAGIGCISKERGSKFFRKCKDHAQNDCVHSIDNAVNDEIACYEELDGISIMPETSVLALGEQTHKLQDEVVQRHERLGTQNINENMETNNVSIKIHSNDRNMAINKCVKKTQLTTNQNYLWHVVN